ncbi:HEPN domain-containing protein [Mycobacterium bourgelatii]|uniref:ApeA N-terminal domain-containing protein n=1 Tax=Mycobacterium bourgelatii TaxID=1273442 RepID=A0A7I9YP48_MYCBU|nr:HEPN domain-containing protein [Mycobacterium bourgelatii]MCV6975324.1 hypothetical protein [Mycobacterium bourgelatii]GFG90445.1 hypothetical protein MBOU_24870 [Mycobacterium bourgelatii]
MHGLAAEGQFWIPGNPENQVRGEFTAELGERPEIRLSSNLVHDLRVATHRQPDGTIAGRSFSANAARSVSAFRPITLHGQLDTGEPVTLLDAQNHGAAGSFRPNYRGTAALIGATVNAEQLYSAVRFRMDRPYWLGHLTDGQTSVVEDDGSTLIVQASGDGNWLVYESSAPASLRQLEMRVVSGCLALLQLALHPSKDRTIRETQVRIGRDGPWLAAYGAAFRAEPGAMEHDPLLTRDQLTVERFAKWIDLHNKLDGLAWVIARPLPSGEQTRVLLLTPLVEGFHSRLPYQQSRFPEASKKSLKRVKQAARRAAAAQAKEDPNLDPNRVHKAVNDALSHMGEVGYHQRAEDIVTEVCAVIPEIADSVPDLPGLLTKVRNELAHHLVPAKDAEALKLHALEWRVASNTTSWLLRALLLLRAGIEPDVLHKRFLMSQRFAFFRANTAQHVRELGWE